MWVLPIFLFLQLALALWGTYYDFAQGKIYVLLRNNDMVSLNFSITGFDDLSKYSTYTLDEIDLQNNQEILTMASPPENSTIFLHSSTLYAFSSSVQDSDYDVCGDGVFQLLKYDGGQDEWLSASDNLTFSDVNDISYYAGSLVFVSDTTSTVYIYGGQCPSSGDVTNRMLSFDLDTYSFANISTLTKPQAFYGAGSLWAPNPQNLLVVGGRASSGWLSMSQLATWNFGSGWLSVQAEQNSTNTITLRTYPLLLPVFSELSDNSTQTFTSDYKVSSVIMAGGTLSGDSDDSLWLKLSLTSNEYTWSVMENEFDPSEVLGAAAIFNTLVVVNSTSSTTKRDGLTSYKLSLYDLSDLLTTVSSLKSNTEQKSSSSSDSNSSSTTTIVVATVVPILTVAIIAVLAFWFWKKRNSSDTHSELHTVDYPLGHFRAISDQSYDPLRPTHLNVYRHQNDSASTLEVGSMDSWVRKRQEYDAKRLRTLKRHSFLASNETLNGHLVGELPEVSDDRFGERIRERYSNRFDESENEDLAISEDFGEEFDVNFEGSDICSQSEDTGETSRNSEKRCLAEKHEATENQTEKEKFGDTRVPERPERPGIVTSPSKLPRVNQLQKSFLYSLTPPQLPQLRKISRLDPGFIDLGQLGTSEENIDLDSCDEDMDVQVLVSSKRKSVLRVMNPDSALQMSEEIRQRTPS